MKTQIKNSNRFLQSNTITVVTTEQAAGAATQLVIAPVGSAILKPGDEVLVVTPYGYMAPLTLDTATSATATALRFSSFTFPFVIPVSSRIIYTGKNIITQAKTKHFYAQQPIHLSTSASTNGNDYLSQYGNNRYSINTAAVLANGDSKPNRWASQYQIFTAPEACTLQKIKGYATTNAGSGDNATISVWKTSPNEDATGNLTITLIKAFALTSQNDQNHLFDLEDSPSSDNDLAEGDIIFVSIKRTGSPVSGKVWYASVGCDIYSIR
jgi:hypothetical protein